MSNIHHEQTKPTFLTVSQIIYKNGFSQIVSAIFFCKFVNVIFRNSYFVIMLIRKYLLYHVNTKVFHVKVHF